MQGNMMSENLSVLLSKEQEGIWIAQGLEVDITAQGSSLDDVLDRWEHLVVAYAQESYRRTGEVFGGIEPAPACFFDLFKNHARSLDTRIPIAFEIEPEDPPVQTLRIARSCAPDVRVCTV